MSKKQNTNQKALAKRVNNNDSIGDIQGHSEDYQQCQDLTRTRDTKSERQYDGASANLFKTSLF